MMAEFNFVFAYNSLPKKKKLCKFLLYFTKKNCVNFIFSYKKKSRFGIEQRNSLHCVLW